MSKVLVRATNWLGDAVMSLPAIRAIRGVFPHAHLAVLARPSVADLYSRETAIDRVIAYPAMKGLGARREFAARLRAQAELFNYATELRSLAQGRGSFTATLDHYDDVPGHIAEKVMDAHRKELEAAGGHGGH